MNRTIDSFATLLQRFFGHLRDEHHVSPHTIAAYRDTFRLLLRFLAHRNRVAVDKLGFTHFGPDPVLAFLADLESGRGNSARTRNARLTAVRAFIRFALAWVGPDFIGTAQRILAIPSKRTDRPVLGFLDRREVEAIIAAPDVATPIGRRDHLLFSLLYNSGARISEALQLTPADITHRTVRLHGKGRKERDVPLWPSTCDNLERWCRQHKLASHQWIFGSRDGRALSRRGAARRLVLALRRAQATCPSLCGRSISLHTFRHTTAMHLLQAKVPIELICLWLGHEQIGTTHGYIEADLQMKRQILEKLKPLSDSRPPRKTSSHVLDFLEAL